MMFRTLINREININETWGNAYLGPQGELYYPFPEISHRRFHN